MRGNHESCSRAGQGWWRFLDPRPLSPGQDCNAAADDASGDYSEPYAVPLGSAAGADTQFIVFDSSLVGVAPLPPSDAMHVRYRGQLERAFALAARRPNTFFMNHHPVLAFAPNPAKPDAPFPGNGALQSVLGALQPTVLFPPEVKALLAGHVHLFEVVSFSTPQPAQFVSGNGGDWIDTPLPSPLPAGTTPMPGRGDREPGGDEPFRLHDDRARRRELADGRARRARRADDLVHAVRAAREMRSRGVAMRT